MDTDAGGLRPALREAVRHPGHLLLPAVVVAVAGGLATTLQTVVHAWTAPTMLYEGQFTFAEGSTAATVTAVVAALLLAVATMAAGATVSLLTAAHQLDRTPTVRAALREVRRRWAITLAFAGLLVLAVGAAGAVAVVALSRLEPTAAALALVAVLVALLVVGALVGRVLPVALARDLSALEAWRLIRAQRRSPFAARCYTNTVWLTVSVVLLGASVNWLVGRLPESLGHPALDAVDSLVQVVTSSVAVAAVAIGMSMAHVRATERIAGVGDEPVTWPGLDRVAPTTEATPRRRTAWLPGPWVVAAASWAVAPLAVVAVVAANPTLAVEPVVTDVAGTIVDPLTAADGDGVAIMSHERLTTCTDEDAFCDAGRVFYGLDHTAVAADPSGMGIAVVGADRADPSDETYVLLTCDPQYCDELNGARVTRASLPGAPALTALHRLHAVAAHDGTYAVVRPTGDFDDAEFVLTLCATANCRQPRTIDLGPAHPADVVRASFAPDGTLWVLQSTAEGDTVRLQSLPPDASSMTDALTLDVPAGDYGYFYAPRPDADLRPPVLELAVRDDGTPVVLYRAPTDGELVLVGCTDAACEAATRVRLPFDPVTTWSAQLAVDSTGRPLIATAGNDVRVHSCADHACTSMRSGLVSLGFPESLGTTSGGAPFMVLDAQDRPVFVVTRSFANVEVRFCRETRCGL